MNDRKPKKRSGGIALDEAAWNYIERLATEQDRSISWTINSIILEHQRRAEDGAAK